MDIEKAKRAGAIAANIEIVQASIAACVSAVEQGYELIGAFTARDTNGNVTPPTSFPAMTAEESSLIFEAAKAIYQSRIDVLNAELADL